ncbi:MAG: hypothetical protein ACFE9L_05260 [Candidatus Hodarchaeota archaeon]
MSGEIEVSENAISNYVFLPYFRTGMSQYIEYEDYINLNTYMSRTDERDLSLRARLTVSLDVKEVSDDRQETIDKEIELMGPGDITKGFNAEMYRKRTDPEFQTKVEIYEPNYLPSIEFSQPDFPWLYTPASPPKSEGLPYEARLRPWVVLIVLQSEDNETGKKEFEEEPLSEDQPFPSIKIYKQGGTLPLPDLEHSWAWCHVQITVPLDGDVVQDGHVLQTMQSHPHNVVSRVFSDRNLKEKTNYRAFLVPAYKSGIFAGLGLSPEDGTKRLQPAWDTSSPSVRLPYYLYWDFKTSERGDFEYLVRLLQPRVIEGRVGVKEFSSQNSPGYGFATRMVTDDLAKPHVVKLEGALKSLLTKSTIWPTSDRGNDPIPFQVELANLLESNDRNRFPDTSPERDDFIDSDEYSLIPPIYGRWPSGLSFLQYPTLAANPTEPIYNRWFDYLNLDPRLRITAGLGTLVVQNIREKILSYAWNQVGAVEKVNQLLRQGQVAVETSSKLFEKNLLSLSNESFLQIISPLHSRVLLPPELTHFDQATTSEYVLSNSILPPGLFSPTFNRITRREGPISSRQRPKDDEKESLVSRLNNGELNRSKEITEATPGGTKTIDEISTTKDPINSWLIRIFGQNFLIFILFLGILFALSFIGILVIYSLMNNLSILETIEKQEFWALILLLIIFILVLLRYGWQIYTRLQTSQIITSKSITSETIKEAPLPGSDFIFTYPEFIHTVDETNIGDLSVPIFQKFAVSIHETFLDPSFTSPDELPSINIDGVTSHLQVELQPSKTIFSRLQEKIAGLQIPENMDELLFAPDFPWPMYEHLAPDLVLPGLEFIPQNTLGIVTPNRVFIETFLIGFQHSTTDMLIYEEYPVETRATFARQFWDVADFFVSPSLKATLREQAVTILTQEMEEEGESFLGLPIEIREMLIASKYEELLTEYKEDMTHIRGWKINSKLGVHDPKLLEEDVEPEDKIVLLIRGDLLKKYPRTVIYALKAQWEEEEGIWVRRPMIGTDDGEMFKFPIFKGFLRPDIYFFGIDLTVSDARGFDEIGTVSPVEDRNDPGWFIILEERVGETRFGLDVDTPEGREDLVKWDDLSWVDFNEFLTENGYIGGAAPEGNANIELPATDDPTSPMFRWVSNGAIRARILLQKPVRISVHADDMMPEEEDT